MKGLGLLIAGTEGIGKTTFAAQFPKKLTCLSIREPGGMEDLIDIGAVDDKFVTNVDVENWEHLIHCVKTFKDQTLVLDSTSGLQRIIFDFVANKHYDSYEEFLAYFKGPRQDCPRYMDTLCIELENHRRQGRNVLLLAHSKVETFKNPKGLDYQTMEIDMDEGIRSVLKKYVSNILFMDLDPGIERVTKSKSKIPIEAKMKETDVRVIFCQKSLTHVAKNKLGLPVIIPMGLSSEEAFENFANELPVKYKEALL